LFFVQEACVICFLFLSLFSFQGGIFGLVLELVPQEGFAATALCGAIFGVMTLQQLGFEAVGALDGAFSLIG
jgi:hypothetical protein